MKTIDFWTPKGKYGFLSNFYHAPTVMNGVTYPTNEHFFQSQKFAGKPQEQYIIALPTPGDTAREGKRRDFPLRSDWEQVKEEIMLQGLIAKFEQHPELLKRLMETKESSLRETSPYDSYWGTGRNLKGKNRLGVLLEKVRDEILVNK
ncbi:Swarming motility protein YbiA [Bacillus sp. M6-12]|uniref:NADAR family protein n=1 Tax=Bacillus sp. M6-12 TaxID=2054166 RepID=UPI000C783391|nr:NADAR family protein [Bacillus sp. M6-12]PLS19609.1 Swarming motility protein YbiA [Bacillus sp. M6-12]